MHLGAPTPQVLSRPALRWASRRAHFVRRGRPAEVDVSPRQKPLHLGGVYSLPGFAFGGWPSSVFRRIGMCGPASAAEVERTV